VKHKQQHINVIRKARLSILQAEIGIRFRSTELWYIPEWLFQLLLLDTEVLAPVSTPSRRVDSHCLILMQKFI